MMDVACYCGSRYSFAGKLGACPKCGEHVTLIHASATEEEQMREELEVLLARHGGNRRNGKRDKAREG